MATASAAPPAQGLDKGALPRHCQPPVSLTGKRIVGAEALARRQRPDGAMLLPAAFSAVAERAGQIRRMTLYRLPGLVDDLAGDGMGGDLCVSFNVTASALPDAPLSARIPDHAALGTRTADGLSPASDWTRA